MTVHAVPIAPDEAEIRAFFTILHEAVGAAFQGVADPGLLQLSRVHPADEKLVVVGRFPIGAVDAMTRAAFAEASAGHNVYVEGRTVRKDLSGNQRGVLADTRGVFALVADADADKGRDADLGEIEPSLSVESSPGNRHHWFFLERAVTAAEGREIGERLRRSTGADDDTGNPTQPYRVAGTPNFPGPKKVARGRFPSPTSVLTEGRSYSAADLRNVLGDAAPSDTPPHGAGDTHQPDREDRPLDELMARAGAKRLDDLAATGVADRSAHFLKVTGWLKGDGFSEAEAVALWSQFPAGAGVEKYGSRLAREVARVWTKTSDDPNAAAEGAAIAERMAANGNTSAGGGGDPKKEGDSRTGGSAGAKASPDPIDPWNRRDPPPLPPDLLPPLIEEFARERGEMIGADPAGIAMTALVACAALITDRIVLKMKRHDDWCEPARLWCALIGPPSAKKSPIISAATRPLLAIDRQMMRENAVAMQEYEELKAAGEKSARPPRQPQIILQDITVEKAQNIFADSPDGVLSVQDELSGWFGSMDRYSGAKGGQKDRAFWLETWNGGYHKVQRVGRGTLVIDNLSMCLVGGIQPDLIRALAKDMLDDGFLQRMMPIVLQPASDERDEASSSIVKHFAWLASRLHILQPPLMGAAGNMAGVLEAPLVFDDEAQEIFRAAQIRHRELADLEVVSRKLGSAAGKYNGLFGRLCVTFHCVEHADEDRPPSVVVVDTVRRVDGFLRRFIWPHAVAFYTDVVGQADDVDLLKDVAGYMLAHPEVTEMTFRNFARGSSAMRSVKDVRRAEEIMDRLDAFGWVERKPTERNQTSARWAVVPRIHEMFADRAKTETDRRQRMRAHIAAASQAAA